MRQTTGTMLCPSCGKLISVEEERCPHCDAWRPALFGFAPGLQRLFGRQLDLPALIIGVCGLAYVSSLVLDLPAVGLSASLFDLGSPSSAALYLLGMTGGAAWAAGHWWTLFTATYLHGSIMHIVFNLTWVRSLGYDVGEDFGPARFFVIYTLAGVGGFLLSNLLAAPPTIGASGAIFGLVGARIAFGRRRGGAWGRQVSGQMWGFAGVGLVFGFLMPGINNLAHIGGFVTGYALGSVFPLAERRREGRPVLLLALGLLVLTVAGFGLSVASWLRVFLG